MAVYKLANICYSIRGNSSFQKKHLKTNMKENHYVALHYGKTYKVNRLNNDYNFFVSDSFYKENQLVQRYDTILISTSETLEDLGHSYLYDREDLGLLGGEQILLKANEDIVNKEYLYYLTKQFKSNFRKYATGMKVYRFKIDDFNHINVNIPSISEQEKIIEIIKPVEKLFLKYSNIVKIDTIENTKKDIQNLIEIIKPLEDVESKLENINNSALEFISSLSNNNMRLSLNDISVSINLRPKNTNQVSAKVMRKRNPLLINIEESNTYKSNSFFTKKGSLLVNTIRPKLNKFCVTPCDLDYNGTSLALQINEHHTAAIKALISDNFWEQCDLLSKGTKMPIISKNDLLNNVKFNAVDIEIPNIYVFFQQLGLLLIKTNALKNSLINLLIK